MASRHVALDHLRAWAMLAGVFFHAALAHSPLVHPVFPTADASQAGMLDLLLWPLHLVRMPVFFVIAGVLAANTLSKGGMAALVRSRARRLLVPFLVLVPLLHIVMTSMVQHAALNVERPSPVLHWLRGALEADAPSLPPGTGHLWFLYYLMLCTVLVWALRQLLPRQAKSALRTLPLKAWALALPLLTAPAFASVSVPHPAPESLLPQFWALTLFGGFYAFGFFAGTRLALLQQTPNLVASSLGGALGVAVFFSLLAPLRPEAGMVMGLVSACTSVWLTLALLGAAQRWMQHRSASMEYLSDAAYWIYLVHLPVLFALQFAWMDAPWPWFVKLPLALLLTMTLCLASFELIVRRGPLGRWFLAATVGSR